MKKFIVATTILIFIAFFSTSSYDDHDIDNISDEISPIGESEIDNYIKTDCQNCLTLVESSECFKSWCDGGFFDVLGRNDWLACVGWCEAYEADNDCYFQCDNSFIGDKDIRIDLHVCICELCDIQCRTLCGAEIF